LLLTIFNLYLFYLDELDYNDDEVEDDDSDDSDDTTFDDMSDCNNHYDMSGTNELRGADFSKVNLKQLAYCPLCNHTLDKTTKKSDQQTKDYIHEMTLDDIMRSTCHNSNSSVRCMENDGNCVANVTVGDVYALRNSFGVQEWMI
jgi:hypothetical protein